MIEAVDYNIVGSYNNQRVSGIDSERSVNLFEYIDPLGKKPKSLIFTSGLVDQGLVYTGSSPDSPFRASFVFNGFIYQIVGNSAYKIGPGLTVSLLSSALLNSPIFANIDANNATNPQVIFVDGTQGFIYDTVLNQFQKIIDPGFPPNPIDVCYLDGFFVVINGGTNTFFLSMLNEGLVWSAGLTTVTTNNGALPNQLIVASNINNFATGVPVFLTNGGGGTLPPGLSFGVTYYAIAVDSTHIELATTKANAYLGIPIVFGGDISPVVNLQTRGQLQQGAITSHPGNIVACRTLHRRIFFFSENYTEVWENAGVGSNLPFRRNNALLMEYGCAAIGSVSTGFDKLFFLSQDKDGLGAVMEVVGAQSIPISNRALDNQLSQYASLITSPLGNGVADARGILIKENGLIFYRLNFTTANHTFVYNVTLSDPSTEEGKRWHEEEILNGNRHPAQVHAYFLGKNYYGDYARPILYEVDSAFTTNAGQAIRRMRIARPMCPGGYQRTRIDRFQLDLLQGQMPQPTISSNNNLVTEFLFDILTEDDNTILIEPGEVAFGEGRLEPTVFLSISKDGGQSYGYISEAPMGNIGQRSFRTVFRKLGVIPRGQAFVPKIEFFNNYPFVILGASWAFEVLPE